MADILQDCINISLNNPKPTESQPTISKQCQLFNTNPNAPESPKNTRNARKCHRITGRSTENWRETRSCRSESERSTEQRPPRWREGSVTSRTASATDWPIIWLCHDNHSITAYSLSYSVISRVSLCFWLLTHQSSSLCTCCCLFTAVQCLSDCSGENWCLTQLKAGDQYLFANFNIYCKL